MPCCLVLDIEVSAILLYYLRIVWTCLNCLLFPSYFNSQKITAPNDPSPTMTLRMLLAGERRKDQETEDGKEDGKEGGKEDGKEDVAYDYGKFLGCRVFLITRKVKIRLKSGWSMRSSSAYGSMFSISLVFQGARAQGELFDGVKCVVCMLQSLHSACFLRLTPEFVFGQQISGFCFQTWKATVCYV